MFDIYTFNALSILISSLIVWKSKPNSKNVKFLLGLLVVWLILYEGLRWEIGTDWDAYYNDFLSQNYTSHSEKGFVLLSGLVRSLTDSYTVFLFVITCFEYTVLYRALKRYSQLPIVSLCIYYCLMLGILGCNRQIIALFICILSLQFILKKKFVLFCICIVVAFFFHTTAIIFLPAYFISNNQLERKWIIVLCLLCLAVGISGVVNRIPFVNYIALLDSNTSEKLSYYTSGDIFGYSYIGTLKRVIIVVICMVLLGKPLRIEERVFCRLYIFGAFLFFIFNGSILQLMAGRGALYYNISEIFIIPMALKYIMKNKGSRMVVWCVYFCLILYIMTRDINSYFLMDGIDIYHPYKTVLF